MLQIVIVHENDKPRILDVKNLDFLGLGIQGDSVCTTDETTGQMILEPLKDFIGELVVVTHFNRINGSVIYDYEHVCVLNGVSQDEKGFWNLDFSSLNG